MWRLYLWIMFGGALGSGARFFLSGWIGSRYGETFPWGTIVVNVAGSFLIGFFATLTEPDGAAFVGPTGRHFFMTGLMGGFTTFSSFSLQTLTLARSGEWLHAGGNVLLSVVLCLVAVWLGYLAAAAINQMKGS